MVIPKKHTEAGALRNVWRAFNELRDFAVSLRMAQGRGIKFHRTAHGTVARLENLGGASEPEAQEPTGEMQRMQILSVFDNYLSCAKYDSGGESVSGEIVNVAMPVYLRKDTYNGLQATVGLHNYVFSVVAGEIRQSFLGSTIQGAYLVRHIFPAYGGDIYALKPTGKTDVVVEGTRLEWIDSNADGRHLDYKLNTVNVCENSVRKTVIYVASNPYV